MMSHHRLYMHTGKCIYNLWSRARVARQLFEMDYADGVEGT